MTVPCSHQPFPPEHLYEELYRRARHYVLLLRGAMRASGNVRPANDLLEIESALLQCGAQIFAARSRRPPPRAPPATRPDPDELVPTLGPAFEGGEGPVRIEIDLTEPDEPPAPSVPVEGPVDRS